MRAIRLVVAMLVVLTGWVEFAATAGAYATCASYSSQAAAQAAYRADPVGLAHLDRDRDGIACEDNPAPYDRVPVQPGGAPPPSQPQPPAPVAEPPCDTYAQTGRSLCRGFRAYWREFGGLAVFGYPLTEEYTDTRTGYVTQWFERARFEWHPGTFPERYDVLLGLLGDEATVGRRAESPFVAAQARADCTYYAATGHNLCGGFRAYWEMYGGLATYGYPISEEFQEKNADTGQVYTVQYFERQRFEWHPGEWPARFDVELGRLGAQLRPS